MLKNAAVLSLEDGTKFVGFSFGAEMSVQGEVVFNTSMIGYPELFSDPGMKGKIVVLTYPLTGNYGVPPREIEDDLLLNFESEKMQIAGLVVTDYSDEYSHWNAVDSLGDWLRASEVPAICGIDTRALAQHLREKGEQRGTITIEGAKMKPEPSDRIAEVSTKEPMVYNEGGNPTIALLDTGVRNNVIRSLIRRGVKVLRLPWNVDLSTHEWDGLMLVDAPGDPSPAAANVARALEKGKPVFGVCGGDKLLALAAGAKIKKLDHSHRSQNQPVLEVGTDNAVITNQNHSWAVDEKTLPTGWKVWYTNLNDGSTEGISHSTKPFSAIAWQPEATNHPEEADAIYDDFITSIRKHNGTK
ncbi:MAG: glutamine-hydrolyzing carbamoyl-phosphate synthase small subunit [Alistipes sp.]|jgi:carbamoyl-phosphate synthase small subunit|nr:glutamine-hydrolyzing carbamoyl-phosphate synthase small subunit [Alistipes sp.]